MNEEQLTEEIYHVENVFQLDIARDTKNQEVPQNVITSKNDQAPSNDLDHDILAANNIVSWPRTWMMELREMKLMKEKTKMVEGPGCLENDLLALNSPPSPKTRLSLM